MKRKPYYSKPNIGNLRGRIGKSILQTVRNTPRPDRSELERDVQEAIEKIMAARANERRT